MILGGGGNRENKFKAPLMQVKLNSTVLKHTFFPVNLQAGTQCFILLCHQPFSITTSNLSKNCVYTFSLSRLDHGVFEGQMSLVCR